MKVLGIESSCDETGVALIDSEKGLLADAVHTQIDMHRAYGGVVPELAQGLELLMQALYFENSGGVWKKIKI